MEPAPGIVNARGEAGEQVTHGIRTTARAACSASLLALAACATVNARAARTPEEVRARAAADDRARECTLAREAALRTFWLAPGLPLSDPIVVQRGQFLGAPVVPRPCAPADRDSARAAPR